jgi:hypothetical protein
VAQIYDVLAVISTNPPKRFGHIPLSPQDPEFQQQRYWRLPKMIGAILAVLIQRVTYVNDGCAEIVAARTIRDILSLPLQDIPVPRPSFGRSSGGGGGGGGRSGDGDAGPSGGGSGGNKSSDRKKRATQPSGSATKKTRQATRDDAVEEDGSESNGEGGESPSSRTQCFVDLFHK